MTENTARQPAGIPAGGQFAATAHAEPAVSLAPPVRPDQEWHDVAATLIDAGKTPAEARSAVAVYLATHISNDYLETGKAAVDRGNEASAVMLALAHTAIRDLPRKIHEAGDDATAVRTAFHSARTRLAGTGSLLNGLHPTGKQPILRHTEQMLTRLESFLLESSEGQS